MKRIFLDKISSATHRLQLNHHALISNQIDATPGTIVAARVIRSSTTYNRMEITGGRMPSLYAGDMIAGVLGNRKALHGHAGYVPQAIHVGDRLHVLNLGGVIGLCESSNPDLGAATEVEILGSVLYFPVVDSRQGVPAHLMMNALPKVDTLPKLPPVIFISGTCMNSGKTLLACEVTRALYQQGLSVAVGKLTGVALQRDILSMLDCGAHTALSFADAGVPSTDVYTALPAARAVLSALAKSHSKTDVIVIELGDGLVGEYGVMNILKASEIQALSSIHIVCAIDPVSAYGAHHLFASELSSMPDLYSGPVTDNQVGSNFISQQLNTQAINAKIDAQKLHQYVVQLVAERFQLDMKNELKVGDHESI